MADTQGIKAGRAYVEIGADESKLKKGLDAASGYLKALGMSIAGIGAMMGAAGGTISASILQATNAFREQAGELSRANSLTGINVERLGEMGYAAQQLGGNLEDITHGMAHMANFLREVRDGSSSATETLGRLGISTHELLNMDLEDAYYRLGSATNALTSRTERLIVARQILGRHGVGTMGVFGAGRERMQQLGAEGRNNGQVMSTADVATGVLLNRQWKQMLGSIKALTIQIGAGLAPQWEFMLNLVKSGADLATRFVKANRAMLPWLDRLATGLTVGGMAFVGLGTGLGVAGLLLRQFYPLASAAWSAISYGIGIVGTLGSTLLSVAAAPFQMAFGAFTSLASLAWTAATAVGGAMISVAGNVLASTVSIGLAIMGGVGSAIGFLISAVLGALPSLVTLAGAISLASGTAAFASGPMGILNAFLAGLGITSIGTSGFMGVLAAAVTAAAVAEEIGLGTTGALGAALTVLGGASGIVGFGLGLLSPILGLLGVSLGGATTGTLAFKVGLWLANAAIVGFNVVVAIAEALTGSWIIPVAVLAGAFALLAQVLLAPILLAGALIGVMVPLVAIIGSLAFVLGGIIFAAMLPAIAAVAAATLGLAALIVGALYLAWDRIKAAAVATWKWITDTAGAAWNWIANRAAALWQGIKSMATSAWDWVADVARSTWDSIVGAATSAWGQISSLFGRLSAIFGTIFESIQTGNLEDALSVAWAAIRLGWVQVTNFLQITWLSWRNAILDVAEGLWLSLREMWHGGAFNLAAIWRALGRMIETSWDGVTTWLRARWADVVDFMTGGSTAGPLQQAAEQARDAANEAQAAPAFDAEAERRRVAERSEGRRRELENARAGGGEAEAQQDLEDAQSMAEWHSLITRTNRENQRAQLEQRLNGQGGGAGDRGGAGGGIRGTFSGAALSGLSNASSERDLQNRAVALAEETQASAAATAAGVGVIVGLLSRGTGLALG